MIEQIKYHRRDFLTTGIKTIAALQFAALGCSIQNATPAVQSTDWGEAPTLAGATAWLNSQPLTAESLRGKVVLINFCTYTCINWLRQLPFIRAWNQKYKDQGLLIIGIHTPEFGFEKDVDNVHRSLEGMKIDYPVAIDSDYAIWQAFRNQYWPALYFVDARGRVRHHQFGEGEYEKSERVIQQLLAETGASGAHRDFVAVDTAGIEAPADWDNLKSPEAYIGYGRAENFVSPGGAGIDEPRQYALPARLMLNHWALFGDWTIKQQFALLDKSGGRIACRFHARDLHLVMGPAKRESPVRFRVTLDEKPPGTARGLDVDDEGFGTASEQRLFQLIRQPKPIAERKFEIDFLDSGIEAFAFTFG
jgi:thiol-disulfide isomerase/thioredoxin